MSAAAENLERVGAISDPGPRLHQPADRIFQQRIEIEEHLRVTLHRRIVSDAAAAIHVLDQAIPETRLELGGPLVLPVLEGARTGNLEAVQESPLDLRLRVIEVVGVDIDSALSERDRGLLDLHGVAAELGLEDRDPLREGMPAQPRRGVGPEEVHQIVTCEAVARFERESRQQREVLARAEADLLA